MFQKTSAMVNLQKIGRSFMLPIALLPAAGILLGVGGTLTNPETIQTYPLLNQFWLQAILRIMLGAGQVVFNNLAILFALAIPISLARVERGTAALAGAIAFFIMHATISQVLQLKGIDFIHIDMMRNGFTVETGIYTLQMGVFGGIIAGIGATWLHNHFYDIKLHPYLNFFAGLRFVPIVTAFAFLFVGMALTFIWPLVQMMIMKLGDLVLSSGYAGTFIYGVIERALIPFGLHHIFYIPFWQTALGGSLIVCDQVIDGAQNIFFQQLVCPEVTHFAVDEGTRFMSGKFPFMMFGLPGAALAMYHCAHPLDRDKVASLLVAGAATSFLTGITEPIEFTFLFIAPFLYAFHCIMAGLSFMLMHILHVGVGLTFSGGLIELFLFGILQGTAKTSWYWIPVVGFFYALIYYFSFKFFIRHFNFKTPGREREVEPIKITPAVPATSRINFSRARGNAQQALADAIIVALGGLDNIIEIDSCITRLHLKVKDMTKVAPEPVFMKLRSVGLVKLGPFNLQLIYGGRAEELRLDIQSLMLDGHEHDPKNPALST